MSRPAALDLVVALNTSTYAKDVAAVRPGGYLDVRLVVAARRHAGARRHYDPRHSVRSSLCVEAFQGDRLRTLLRNIAYVGALAAHSSRSTWTSSARCPAREIR